jgi:hypothetical protein
MLSAEARELSEELQPLLGRPDRHQRLHDEGVGARGTVRAGGVDASDSWGSFTHRTGPRSIPSIEPRLQRRSR